MTTEQAPGPTIDPRFYSLQDAARILDVHPSTLSRACADGTFPHVRVGRTIRVPMAEVERLERGDAPRSSVLSVPDYEHGVPSLFTAPEADSPEDHADMAARGRGEVGL